MSKENESVTLKLAYFLEIANEIRINELESRFFPTNKKEKKEIEKDFKFFVSLSTEYVYQSISVATLMKN